MKAFIKNITSMFLAFLVLFTTMSFTVNMHYCGDTLVDTAIFQKVKTCGMNMQKATTTSECAITKKNCCNSEQIVVDGQDELQLSIDTLTFDQQLFITSIVYTYINLFEGLDRKPIPFNDYSAPLIVKDIQVLDEVYII